MSTRRHFIASAANAPLLPLGREILGLRGEAIQQGPAIHDGFVLDRGGAVFNVRNPVYGARGDTRVVTDGSMAALSTNLTSAFAQFTAADVGKLVSVAGAGVGGGPLNTTITAIGSPTQAVLGATARAGVSKTSVVVGTDDTAAIAAALVAAAAAGAAPVFIPAGNYLITRSLALRGTSFVKTPIIGSGGRSVLVNRAPANTPTIQLSGCEYFEIRNLGFAGIAQFPNAAIHIQKDTAGNRSACGVIHNVVLEPNGIGIHLQDCNSIVIRDCAYWPSGLSSFPATTEESNRIGAVVADGAGAVNDVTLDNLNAIPRVPGTAGASVRWATTEISNRITLRACELEGSPGANHRAVDFSSVHGGIGIYDCYLDHAELRFLNCRDGFIAGCQGADNARIVLGDNTAAHGCARIFTLSTIGGSMSVDPLSDHCGAIMSSFGDSTGYRNSGTNRVTVSVFSAGVYVPNELPGSVRERDRRSSMGEWITPRLLPRDFGGRGMAWTVAPSDVSNFQYSLVGTTMTVQFSLIGTSVGGTLGPALQLRIPGGYVAARTAVGVAVVADDGGESAISICDVDAASEFIMVHRSASGARWSASANRTSVRGSITFEIR